MAGVRVILLSYVIHSATTRFTCPDQGFYRDPDSCTAFYRCITKDMSYHYICPLGTRYDPTVENCNHNHLAPPCPGAEEDYSLSYDYSYDVDNDLYPEDDKDDQDDLSSYLPPGPPDNTVDDSEDDKLPGNINNGATNSPELTTDHAQITEDQPSSQPQDKPGVTFLVSPTSLYPCQEPGYFSEQSSCTEFYVCREIAPGVLAAEALFRCPDRYVFDVETSLCQRKTKVTCEKDVSHLFNAFRSAFVFQLHPSQLNSFFTQELRVAPKNMVPNRTQFYPPILWLPSSKY